MFFFSFSEERKGGGQRDEKILKRFENLERERERERVVSSKYDESFRDTDEENNGLSRIERNNSYKFKTII